MNKYAKAVVVPRGCGVSRTPGDVYWEVGMGSGPGAAPVEDFLLDPPIPLSKLFPTGGISANGVQLYCDDASGIYHVIDWIGSKHYPDLAGYIEEVRRFGVSRKIQKNLDFSRLSPDSRLLTVHANAIVKDHDSIYYHQHKVPTPSGIKIFNDVWNCPQAKPPHIPQDQERGAKPEDKFDPTIHCAGIWWEDVESGETFNPEDHEPEFWVRFEANERKRGVFHYVLSHDFTGRWHPRLVKVTMPSFYYFAHRRPENVKIKHEPGVFASFPLSRLVVVAGNKARDTAAMIKNKTNTKGIIVEEVDE